MVWMTMAKPPTPAPLVSREALMAFTGRLVETFAPEKVILFGSLARGDARWDSDADILVVMPYEGRPLAKIGKSGEPAGQAFRWICSSGNRKIWGLATAGAIRSFAKPWTMERFSMAETNPVVGEWITKAEAELGAGSDRSCQRESQAP